MCGLSVLDVLFGVWCCVIDVSVVLYSYFFFYFVILLFFFLFLMILRPPSYTLFPYTSLYRFIVRAFSELPGYLGCRLMLGKIKYKFAPKQLRSDEHKAALQSHLQCSLMFDKKQQHYTPHDHQALSQ